MNQPNTTPADLRGETALDQARNVTAYNTTCEWCGAKPGRPCYGNGDMPAHADRLGKARTEALARALLWVDEFRGSVAAARIHDWDAQTLLQDLDRILSPSVESYLHGDAN